MSSSTRWWSFALLVAPLMAGCSHGDSGPETTAASEVVVNVDDLSNQVAVYSDRLELDADVLPKLESRGLLKKIETYASAADKSAVEPVYFVGNRQSGALNRDGSIKDGLRNPSGFLRRAISWQKGEGGVIVVKTEPASLSDAIEEIKKNGALTLGTSSLGTDSLKILGGGGGSQSSGRGNWDQTWSQTFGPSNGFTVIDLSGKTIWSHKLLSNGNASVVLTKGRISLKPTVDAHVLIQNFIPQNGHVILTSDVEGEVEFTATADGAFELSKDGSLFTQSFGGMTGGVPLTLSVEVKWSCGLGVSGNAVARVGAKANGRIRAGAEFQGTTITPILDRPTYAFERIGPTVTSNVNVQGECHLVSEIALQLFDTAGPTTSVDLYSRLSANASTSQLGGHAAASLTAGVIGTVGGSLRPFGIKIADINHSPFTFEREIFNGEITIGE